MKIEWAVPIRMDDGLVLRADVFLPQEEGRYPAILTYGHYGKGLSFQEGYKSAWHCQHDNPTLGQELMIDWLADVFGIDQHKLEFAP